MTFNSKNSGENLAVLIYKSKTIPLHVEIYSLYLRANRRAREIMQEQNISEWTTTQVEESHGSTVVMEDIDHNVNITISSREVDKKLCE